MATTHAEAPTLTPRMESTFKVVATTSVSLLAVLAGVLSYAGLRDLALDAGINERLAWAFPILIDGLTFVGSIGVIHAVLARIPSWYPWTLTLLGVSASVVGNVASSPPTLLAQAVHAAPPIVLALSLEALLRVYRARAHGHGIGLEQSAPGQIVHHSPEPTSAGRSPDVTEVTAERPVGIPADRVHRQEPSAPVTDPSPSASPAAVAAHPLATPQPVAPAATQPRATLEDEPRETQPAASPARVQREPEALTETDSDDPATIRRAHTGPATVAPHAAGEQVDPFAIAPRPSLRTESTLHAVDSPEPPTAKDQIARMLLDEPDITGNEVARRLEIDPSYARRCLRELRSNVEDSESREALIS